MWWPFPFIVSLNNNLTSCGTIKAEAKKMLSKKSQRSLLEKQSSGKYNENKRFDYFNHIYLFEKFFNFKSQKHNIFLLYVYLFFMFHALLLFLWK